MISSNNHVGELCARKRLLSRARSSSGSKHSPQCSARHERRRLLLRRPAPRAAAPSATAATLRARRRAQHSARPVSATRARRAVCSPVRAAAAVALPAPCCARGTRGAAAARWPAARRAALAALRADGNGALALVERLGCSQLERRAHGRRARLALRAHCRARECFLSLTFGSRLLEQKQRARSTLTSSSSAAASCAAAASSATRSPSAAASRALRPAALWA